MILENLSIAVGLGVMLHLMKCDVWYSLAKYSGWFLIFCDYTGSAWDGVNFICSSLYDAVFQICD